MREKLMQHVRSCFRDMPDTPRNRDLQEEILCNTLDRYDDLISQGVPEAAAYAQASASIGDVRQLWEQPNPETPKKRKRRYLIVLLVLIVLLIGGAMVLDEIYLHKGALEYAETQAEKWSDDIEEQAEQWAEELEENLRESFGDAEKKHGFGSNISYGQANSYTAGDADIVSDRIQQLQIEWLSGSVTVKPYDGSTVQIKETGADAPEEQLRWLLSDSKLTVQYAAEGHYLQLPAKDLTVLVPAGKSFDRISIQSVSAEADLQDIEARQLSLQSTSGDLSAVGSFHEAEIHTISGEVSFRGVSADIEVETTSGDAAVTLTETPDEFSFDGVSGDLKLWVPENRGFELEHDTVSGSFSCALSTTQTDKNTLRFAGSGPAASLNLETVSGNLTISVFKE